MGERKKMELDSWVVAAGRPDEPGSPLNDPLVTASNFAMGGEFVYRLRPALPGGANPRPGAYTEGSLP